MQTHFCIGTTLQHVMHGKFKYLLLDRLSQIKGDTKGVRIIECFGRRINQC